MVGLGDPGDSDAVEQDYSIYNTFNYFSNPASEFPLTYRAVRTGSELIDGSGRRRDCVESIDQSAVFLTNLQINLIIKLNAATRAHGKGRPSQRERDHGLYCTVLYTSSPFMLESH